MSTLNTLPPEIHSHILIYLPTAHDLRQALLSTRSLWQAYLAHYVSISHQIFLNEHWVQPLTGTAAEWSILFAHLRLQISGLQRVEARVAHRQLLWKEVKRFHIEKRITRAMVFWVGPLGMDLRETGNLGRAWEVEVEALRLLRLKVVTMEARRDSKVLEEEAALVPWVKASLGDWICRGRSEEAVTFCDAVLSTCCEAEIQHETMFELILGLRSSMFPHKREDRRFSDEAARSLLSKAWALVWTSRRRTAHLPMNQLCQYCKHAATQLCYITQNLQIETEITRDAMHRLWTEAGLRNYAAEVWVRESMRLELRLGTALTALMRIWETLKEQPTNDIASFTAYDLEWARALILELRKQEDGGMERSLVLQAEVLAMMRPEVHPYYAFARNLADEYVKASMLDQAFELRERLWLEMEPSSRFYASWGLELAKLCERKGNKQRAEEIRVELGLLPDRDVESSRGKEVSNDVQPLSLAW